MNLRINNMVVLAVAILLTTFSCKKDEVQVIAGKGTTPNLTTSTNTLTLEEASAANKAVSFNWNEAEFGYAAAINYTLQISFKDSAFRRFTSVGLGTTLAKDFTVGDFNTLLLGAKYSAGTAQSVWVRVLAQVTDSLYSFSDTVKLTVTPYKTKRVINYPALYVPGGYQGWAPGDPTIARLFSVASNGSYQGYVQLPDAANLFKFTPAPNWNSEYGAATAPGKLQQVGGGNLEIDGSGYYLVKANTKQLTWSSTLENWGIIGDAAGGWGDNDDVMFDFDPVEQVLHKTLPLKVGGVKFRTNHLWTLQLGEGAAYGGGNITIDKAGTYEIILDLRVPEEPVLSITEQ